VDAVLVTTASLLLVAAAWSMLRLIGRRWPLAWVAGPDEGAHWTDDDEGAHWTDDGEGDSGVREPRRPRPSTGGAAAYAEPDERAA
jgi:hypothetical protein